MENYIQLSIGADLSQQEILIALLSENGFEGFEEDENKLLAFIPEKKFNAINVDEMLPGISLSYSKKIIEQKNW
ncbi:MAG TPA: hypothetical protein VHZ50_05330, partial [Puia sp.]|nr:hypothetical protein [Puia sp.]